MDIHQRVMHIRSSLNMSQELFGEKIGLSKSGISNIEKGTRSVTERHIKLISSQFNVNEDWIRTGEGEMFIQPEKDIWEEYARRNGMSELESKILKAYMSIDSHVREIALKQFLNAIVGQVQESAATKEIESKTELYRKELEAEKNSTTSLASQIERGGVRAVGEENRIKRSSNANWDDIKL